MKKTIYTLAALAIVLSAGFVSQTKMTKDSNAYKLLANITGNPVHFINNW